LDVFNGWTDFVWRVFVGMSMVRLPALAGSEPLSPPDSPLKSFPWMRFVEDIEWEKRKRAGSELREGSRFNIPTQPVGGLG
jgi:hypothetical protein